MEKQTQYITIALAAIIIVAIGVLIYTNMPQTQQNNEDDTPLENAIALTVSYNNEQTEYTLDDLQQIDVVTGYGGYRTNFPSIKGQGTYTGIPIQSLVTDITGSLSDYSVKVISNEEGTIENQTYNYSVIQGNVPIYNASNASSQIGTGGVTMIIAYQYNGELLDEEDDGTLKIAFINQDEEKITPSYLWWKFVKSIEIISS